MRPRERTTAYVDNKVMVQGGTTHQLQEKLDHRIDRAQHLNIQFAPAKLELMHLLPFTSGRKIKNADITGLTLDGAQIPPTDTVQILGVRTDKLLNFKIQASQVSAKTRTSSSLLDRVSRQKGAAPGKIHHLAVTAMVPVMLWGSEIWWTEARQITDQISPAYKMLECTIPGLRRWTQYSKAAAKSGPEQTSRTG